MKKAGAPTKTNSAPFLLLLALFAGCAGSSLAPHSSLAAKSRPALDAEEWEELDGLVVPSEGVVLGRAASQVERRFTTRVSDLEFELSLLAFEVERSVVPTFVGKRVTLIVWPGQEELILGRRGLLVLDGLFRNVPYEERVDANGVRIPDGALHAFVDNQFWEVRDDQVELRLNRGTEGEVTSRWMPLVSLLDQLDGWCQQNIPSVVGTLSGYAYAWSVRVAPKTGLYGMGKWSVPVSELVHTLPMDGWEPLGEAVASDEFVGAPRWTSARAPDSTQVTIRSWTPDGALTRRVGLPTYEGADPRVESILRRIWSLLPETEEWPMPGGPFQPPPHDDWRNTGR